MQTERNPFYMSKRVLFVSYGGGHVAALAPVFSQVSRSGIEADYLALTTAQLYLRSRNIPFFGFDGCPGSDDWQVQNWGEQLLSHQILIGEIDPGRAGFNRHESIAYLGLSFRDLVDSCGEEEAWRRFKQYGRPVFEPIRTLQDLLRKGRYDALVTTNSPRAEKASILAAFNLAIPSVCVVDLFAVPDRERLRSKDYADKLCVMIDRVKQSLVDAGRPAETIEVTGNPAFDALHAPLNRQNASKLMSEWRLNKDSKVVMWVSHSEPAYHRITGQKGDKKLPNKILSLLIDMLENNPSMFLIVRPHPSESICPHAHQRLKVCGQEYPIETLLHLSDLVVTMTSTVGLQALILGKLVVAARMSLYESDSPLAKIGLKTGVDRLEDLEDLVINLLFSNQEYEQNWFTMEYGRHANASSNVANVLSSLL